MQYLKYSTVKMGAIIVQKDTYIEIQSFPFLTES